MNGPSKVSSGNIAPKIVETQTGSKEVLLFTGVGICLGGVLLAAWYYGQYSTQPIIAPAPAKVEKTSLPAVVTQPVAFNHVGTSITTPSPLSGPVVTPSDRVIHEDVYFEAGRKGLTDEAKAQIATRAEFLTQHEDYGILIQGYTDQQGSTSYNKTLGLKRAETVKGELTRAGIAEHRIATVSLGEEGVLCVDNSEVCRHINRRAHLEIHKIGQEHMATPTAVVTPIDTIESEEGVLTDKNDDSGLETEEIQPPNPEPVPGS